MKLQYLIDPSKELSTDYLRNAIQQFTTKELPSLNRSWNYFRGKQKIQRKQWADETRPCNRLTVNYCNSITKEYQGYLTGIPITYSNDEFEDVINVLNYNDVATEDSEYLKAALVYGRAFEICYIDEEGKQRFRLFDTRTCFPIYSNSLNNELLYVVRFYKENIDMKMTDDYFVEVYGPSTVKKYKSDYGWNSFELIDEYTHFYNQCPVTVFSLNEDEESIFEQVLSLQDAYNTLISAGVDDIESFADAYLVLKGVMADGDDLMEMKKHRVLGIDTDASAEYLTKDINNEQFEYMLDQIHKQIFRISLAPDMQDEKFLAQSGEAIKYKLTGFENASSGIVSYMTKALQRRIELICSILQLTDDSETWRDVQIHFTRNLPNSLTPMTVSELNQYKGLVSDETLLGLVPFVDDVDKEMGRVSKQTQDEMDLYGEGSWNTGKSDN